MFADIKLDRKTRIKTWVVAAMNANMIAQIEVMDGKISPERLRSILSDIAEGAVNHILGECGISVKPSIN
jgi:hypothetical protein